MSRLLLAAVAVASAVPALAAPDDAADKGAGLYQARCAMCHSPEAGQAPSLDGVVGRKAGSAPGFDFSKALAGSGITWSAASLDAFLADPSKAVPGTVMFFQVPDAADRAAIIAYLATLKP